MTGGIRTPDLPTSSSLDSVLGNKDSGAGPDTVVAPIADFAAQLGVMMNLTTGVIGVKDKDLSAPPASPASGDRYIVGPAPTGAWAGHANHIATSDGSAWDFIAPGQGATVLVTDEFELYSWNASTSKWATLTSAPLAFPTVAALNAVTGAPANVEAHVLADVITATVSRARASNVATLVFGAAHGLSAGAVVNVRGLGGSGYNGRVTVSTAPNSTTITYASTGVNEATTADITGQIDRNGVYASNGSGGWNFISDLDVDILRAEIAAIPATVQTSIEHWRTHEKRDQTARANGAYAVTNRQTFGNIALRNATRNADGTITIPANDYIMSEQWGFSFSGTTDAANPLLWWYLWVGVADLGGGETTLAARYQSTDWTTGGGLLSGTTITTVAPGVQKLALRNNNGSGGAWTWIRWFIHAPADAPITIYPPIYTTDDLSRAPEFQTAADNVAVPSIPVYNHDWSKFSERGDRAQRFRGEKAANKVADSVNGSNSNAGTLYAPKQTLAAATGGALGQGDILGLYRGGLWRETIPTAEFSAPHGVEVIDVSFGDVKALPKVSAFKAVPDGAWTDNADGTYSYSWMPTDALVDNGYDEVYAIRRDTTIAATHPITCEARLDKAASAAACVATADTYHVTVAGGVWTMMIHPIDGAAPGTRYTYEVIDKYYLSDWTTYLREGLMQGLWLSGACFGYGMIGGPSNFVGDRLILTNSGTHAAVIQGGIVQRTLMYGNGKGNPLGLPLVFYTANSTGRRCVLRDSYVIGTVIGGFLTHNSGGDAQAWEDGLVENVAFIGGGRQANGALVGAGLGGNNIKNLAFRNVYVEGFQTGASVAPVAMQNGEISRSVFKRVGFMRSAKLVRDNILQLENVSDPTNVGFRGSRCMEIAAGHVVEKNIFYPRYIDPLGSLTDPTDKTTRVLTGTAAAAIPNGVAFRRNIVLFGAGLTQCYVVVGLNTGYADVDMDYNVYIHVSGTINVGGTQFSAPYPQTWADYLTQNGGLDAHSLYIDLRADPRGVKAIFVDPDNGDFRFAQTAVAKQVADYCVANGVGPDQVISRWPIIPSADEIALMIQRL